MIILAIIPARGGSKTLLRKNMAPIKGLPMVGWTINAAKESKIIDKIVVSTNSKIIQDFCISNGAEVPFLRPNKFSGDSVHSIHVVLHTLNWLKVNQDYHPDIVVMLLPTSPMRKSLHLIDALHLYSDTAADAVISVSPSTPLGSLRYIKDGGLVAAVPMDNNNFQRQEVDSVYAVNGAIFITSPELLIKHETFHLPHTVPYIMSKEDSIDVNTLDDLKLAEKLL